MKKEVININEDKRNYGLDLIRVLAVTMVVAVHFFFNTLYYSTDISGKNMHIQTIIRNFCMSCVPLFLLLTGYLNNKKEYNKSFFKGLFNIIIIWLFYSVIEYCFINIWNGTHGNLNLKKMLFTITSFRGCRYSWYIEMYIGIYLLTPLINRAYDSFDKRSRKIVVAIMVMLTTVSFFVNNILAGAVHLPSYWHTLYPLSYYLVGKFICDFKPSFNRKNLFLLLAFNQIFIFAFQYIQVNDYNSLSIFTQSVIIFLLLYNIKIKKVAIKKILKYFSSIALDIYLASSVIDLVIYPLFAEKFAFEAIGQTKIIFYAPVILIIVFVLSTIYASVRKKLINIR